MKYRCQSIPNGDVCSTGRDMGSCLPADSARKAVLGNYVFRGTPWRIDRLCTCNPHKPLQTALISFCKLHPGGAPQHVGCGEAVLPAGGAPFLGAPRWTLVSNSPEAWSPAPSTRGARNGRRQGAPLVTSPRKAMFPQENTTPPRLSERPPGNEQQCSCLFVSSRLSSLRAVACSSKNASISCGNCVAARSGS